MCQPAGTRGGRPLLILLHLCQHRQGDYCYHFPLLSCLRPFVLAQWWWGLPILPCGWFMLLRRRPCINHTIGTFGTSRRCSRGQVEWWGDPAYDYNKGWPPWRSFLTLFPLFVGCPPGFGTSVSGLGGKRRLLANRTILGSWTCEFVPCRRATSRRLCPSAHSQFLSLRNPLSVDRNWPWGLRIPLFCEICSPCIDCPLQ